MSGKTRTLDCWLDEKSGLPCLMLLGQRGEGMGYVGVPPDHPYYDIDTDLLNLKAHGGIAFANEVFRAEEGSPFSRLFSVYSGDSLYVFGFDCGRGGDFVPAFLCRALR